LPAGNSHVLQRHRPFHTPAWPLDSYVSSFAYNRRWLLFQATRALIRVSLF
jgi:hypothetical protein